MDLATLLGITVGTGLLLGAILLDGSLNSFFNVQSVMIVLGGTTAAILVNFSLKQVLGLIPLVRITLIAKSHDTADMISTLVEFAESARREGLLALEEKAQDTDEDFLKKGVQLIVDGTDAELVRSILQIELSFIEDRHRSGQNLLEQMGAFAPAFGMIGTLIGLIQMLQQLDDPSQIGSGMAVALLTTLYGAVLANLIFLPMAAKLKIKSTEELQFKEIMIEGILSIQAGENPRILEEKLKAFLPPRVRLDSDDGMELEGASVNG